MPNEDEYRSWKATTFGSDYMIWHDGLDVSAVQSLSGDARETALLMLRAGVESGDTHAAQALAAMRDLSAMPGLRSQLRGSSGQDRVRVALALHSLSPDDSLAKELVDVLEDASLHWGVRIRAAMGLREFGDATSERALLAAVGRDGDYLVRYHAADSLLARWRVVPSTVTQHKEIFELMKEPSRGPVAPEEQIRLSQAKLLLEGLRKSDN